MTGKVIPMTSKVRTPAPKRQRTGTVERFTRADGTVYYRGKVRLGDGSRERVDVDEPFCLDKEQARSFVAELQLQEDIHGRRLAGKRGTSVLANEETASEWCTRWLAWRTARGLSTTPHDKGRLKGYVLPVLGPLAMHAVSREDVERVVEDLDRRIALPAEHTDRISWKTASNAWVLVSKMFKDAMSAKQRDLRVRTDNPAAGVAPPEHGDRKAKVYLYPSELARLVVCATIALPFRVLYAVAVYTYARAGELEALTWDDVDLEHGVIQINKAIDRETGLVKSTKSGETRRIPIEPELRPLLERLCEERTNESVLWMPDNEDRAALLRQHLAQAGVTRADLFADNDRQKHVTFHDLRATGITWMAVRGDDPLRIKQRAGHSSFSTTEMYIREAENLAVGFGEVFPPLPEELVGSAHRSKLRSNGEGSAALTSESASVSFSGATGDRTRKGALEALPSTGHRALGNRDTLPTSADDALNAAQLDRSLDRDVPLADVVEQALARAIEAEVQGRSPGWEARVALLAGELQARRLARGGVATLDAKKRQRGA
jgi:integrase